MTASIYTASITRSSDCIWPQLDKHLLTQNSTKYCQSIPRILRSASTSEITPNFGRYLQSKYRLTIEISCNHKTKSTCDDVPCLPLVTRIQLTRNTYGIMISVQHPPAIKVGGRRLSISARPKHHTTSEIPPVTSNPTPENVDYPRPAAPGDEHNLHHNPPPHTDEEVPSKKEKKHWVHENEVKLKESAHRKTEDTRPSKDMIAGSKGFGAAGRIAQPAGKGFNL